MTTPRTLADIKAEVLARLARQTASVPLPATNAPQPPPPHHEPEKDAP
jgi:hypothetical protein